MKEMLVTETKKHLTECGCGVYMAVEKAIKSDYFVSSIKDYISKVAFMNDYEITINEVDEIFAAAIA